MFKIFKSRWKLCILGLIALISMICAGAFAFFPSAIINHISNKEVCALGMKAASLKINGANIHYVEGGEGTQVLLLVHGFRSSKAYWQGYLPLLLKNYHVIALDLPGHGLSDRMKGQGYDLVSLGHFLETFVEAKGLTSFNMLGASMGGGAALAYTCKHPGRVKKLALINPLAVYPPQLSEVHEGLARGENLLLPKDMTSFRKMQQVVYGKTLRLDKLTAKLILNSLLSDRDFFLKAFDQMVQAGGLEAHLPKVNVPTLLIQSTDDRVVDPSSAQLIQQLLPSVTLKWAQGGAHTLTGEVREWAGIEITSFFESNDETKFARTVSEH